jgi:SAM-dependent methyltransferase
MSVITRLKRTVKVLFFGDYRPAPWKAPVHYTEELPDNLSSSEYWTRHNVTSHEEFSSREESLKYLRWRCSQYLFYDQLMPCSGFDDQVVLDYGCGPGNDVVGFLEYSNPRKVVAMDVSKTSLQQTQKRAALHNHKKTETAFLLIKENEKIPLPDNSVDYIHSSGVLHHTPNLSEILDEFRRILKPGGKIRIMVYNYNSIWVHLYVPYELQILKGIDSTLSLKDAFRRSTDGPHCPISNVYTPEEFLAICLGSNLKGKCLGSAISHHEMNLLPLRFNAQTIIKVAEEHRDFLRDLVFDEFQRPIYRGHVAGIDAFFELHK